MLTSCCAYSCTQYNLHTQYMFLTHADVMLCLQLHTILPFFLNFIIFNSHASFRLQKPNLSLNTSVSFRCPHCPVPCNCPFFSRALRYLQGVSGGVDDSSALSRNSDVISLCFLFLASLRRKWRCLVAKLELDIFHVNSNFVYCCVPKEFSSYVEF